MEHIRLVLNPGPGEIGQQLQHLPGLPAGMPTLETAGFRKTQQVATQAIEDDEIAAFTGDAGLGKTFAVDYAARMSGVPWVWVQIGPAPRPKEVVARLLNEITGSWQPGTLYELTGQVVSELSEQRHVVVIDEAQNLNKPGLDQIRLLHDITPAGFPLFLVGGRSCAATICSDPQLEDRVGGWVQFKPLTGSELFTILDAYHPFFSATDPHLIAELDKRYAKGVIRRWSRILKNGLALAAGTATPDRITPPVIRAILATLQHET